jgi:formamidopyrimidine-DNA glycosylase
VPELPEVETVARGLRASVVGRRIVGVWTSGKKLRRAVDARALRGLVGRAFSGVRRHGKYLLLDLDDGRVLLAHLGMTGHLLARSALRPAHAHVRVDLDRGTLWYADARRFGLLHVCEGDGHAELAALGPDALEELSADDLVRACRRTRRRIKDVLLDQRVAAGIGNIYACEALFRAGIDPRRRASRLPSRAIHALHAAVRAVLADGVAGRGTTMRDFVAADGRPGDYAEELRVYGREGRPCAACRTQVRRLVWGGRSTFFCPRCQK